MGETEEEEINYRIKQNCLCFQSTSHESMYIPSNQFHYQTTQGAGNETVLDIHKVTSYFETIIHKMLVRIAGIQMTTYGQL